MPQGQGGRQRAFEIDVVRLEAAAAAVVAEQAALLAQWEADTADEEAVSRHWEAYWGREGAPDAVAYERGRMAEEDRRW